MAQGHVRCPQHRASAKDEHEPLPLLPISLAPVRSQHSFSVVPALHSAEELLCCALLGYSWCQHCDSGMGERSWGCNGQVVRYTRGSWWGTGGDGHPQDLLATAFKSSTMGKGQSHRVWLSHAGQGAEWEVTKAGAESCHSSKASGGVTACIAVWHEGWEMHTAGEAWELTLPGYDTACAEWDLTVGCWVSGQPSFQMLHQVRTQEYF